MLIPEILSKPRMRPTIAGIHTKIFLSKNQGLQNSSSLQAFLQNWIKRTLLTLEGLESCAYPFSPDQNDDRKQKGETFSSLFFSQFFTLSSYFDVGNIWTWRRKNKECSGERCVTRIVSTTKSTPCITSC